MILERIKQFIDYKGIAVSAFEKSIGMSNASFGKSLKNGGAIGTDKLENILTTYPELSAEWLLTGRGDMVRIDTDTPTQASDTATVMQLVDTIRQQAQEIGRLKEQIRQLENSGGQNVSDADSETVARAV